MMPVVMTGIGYYVFNRIIQLYVWLVLCFGITSVAAFIQWISKKNLIRWVIKIEMAVTAYIIIWMLVDDLIDIIKYRSMWFGIWLALCFAVTAVTVVVQLINKKFRKKKPIHWVIKLAGYVAFYTISYFIMKTMQDVLIEIGYLIFCRIIQPHVWPVLCLGITAVAAFIQWISKKNLIRRVIKIEVTVTACIIIWTLVDKLIDIIKYESMWFGIWLALCFAVTVVTVVDQLINKKFRKKKPIHWGIELAGYVAFYTISYFIMKTMSDVLTEIGYLIFCRIIQLHVWPVLCLGITAVAAFIQWISKKKLIRRVIKIEMAITVCIIIWMLVDDLIDIIKYGSMWFGIWLALCFAVTTVTAVAQLINKKFRKKKPIHWGIKLAGYATFYIISYFAIMNLLGSYPGNWLGTDKEYRELAYDLYNLELDCYGYEGIHKGSHGEIVFSFEEITYHSDHILRSTLEQRDYIMIKTAVEDYIKENRNFYGKRINIEFCYGSTPTQNRIYNFDPRTGEMGTDVSYWFVTDARANNCTELAELYHDFSGINAWVGTLDDMQELVNIRNLTYLQLNVSGTVREDKALEEQYLEELNTLLPDCEIYLNQNNNTYPDWENFSN